MHNKQNEKERPRNEKLDIPTYHREPEKNQSYFNNVVFLVNYNVINPWLITSLLMCNTLIESQKY